MYESTTIKWFAILEALAFGRCARIGVRLRIAYWRLQFAPMWQTMGQTNLSTLSRSLPELLMALLTCNWCSSESLAQVVELELLFSSERGCSSKLCPPAYGGSRNLDEGNGVEHYHLDNDIANWSGLVEMLHWSLVYWASMMQQDLFTQGLLNRAKHGCCEVISLDN